MLNLKPASPLLLLSALTACAAPGVQFPSLERRPYETSAPVAATAESAAPSAVPSAELATKLNALLTRHTAANQDFLRGLGAVQATASKAAATGPGSEAWVNAQLMLSRLDKMRAGSVAVLREFDGLIADVGAVDADMAALVTEAQRPVAEDVAAQSAEIARLSRLIGE
ncbi:hypothetical protein [Sphingorhabdus sp.]|uniref:hypothetical protein n=1 Tax=Sphingorhabdus sp. TaxID=1902408 RepID=UPI00333F8638